MNILLSKIQADVNQPRKNFNAARLNELKDSIKKHGIINPLVVEKIAADKYQLIDGERRFRAANLLHLKEVPVTVIAPKNAVDRIVQQFHIQEQHENWSGTEKAMAILRLSEETDMTLAELCNVLNIPERTAGRYLAFSRLVDKDQFVRSNIGLEWGHAVDSIKKHVRKLIQNEIGKTFTHSDEKSLESSLVRRIGNGEFRIPREIVKLKDAFTKDPKTIEKFMDNDKVTAVGLFASTGAQGAYALRNIRNNAGYIASHTSNFLKLKDVKVDEQTVIILKKAKDSINQLLNLVE